MIKNKLFFFGTYAESIQPNSVTATATYLSPAAQQGLFSYRDTRGVLQTVNVLQVGQGGGGSGTVLPGIASQFSKINGVVSQGTLTQNPSDPNLATLSWLVPQRTTIWYPTVRVDYNLTDGAAFQRLLLANQELQRRTTIRRCGRAESTRSTTLRSGGNNKIAGFGFDWTVKPTLINQFHAGFTYQYSYFQPREQGHRPEQHPADQLRLRPGTLWRRRRVSPPGGFLAVPSVQLRRHGELAEGQPPVCLRRRLVARAGSLLEQSGRLPQHRVSAWQAAIRWCPPSFPRCPPRAAPAPPISPTPRRCTPPSPAACPSVNINTGRPLDTATKQYKPFGQYNLDEVTAATHFFFQDRWRLRPEPDL